MAIAKRTRKSLTDAERAAKLKELAAPRMGRALRAIRHVGLLTRYNPNTAQKTAMISALSAAVTSLNSVFAGKETKSEFELPA